MIRTRWLTLFGALVVVPALVAAGCQSEKKTTNTTSGTGGTTTTTTTQGGGGSGATGGNNTGGGDPTCGSGAVDATIQQITQGTIGPGVDVKITGAVVMSQKFVIDGTLNAGQPCLWAVFVSAPGLTTTAANTGTLVLSYGSPAVVPDGGSQAYCPLLEQQSGGDAIPDDIQPGDVVDIIGETDSFLLNACSSQANGSQVPEFQVSKTCRMTVTGSTTPPAPAVIPANDYANLSNQAAASAAFHNQWGGVFVRLANVTSTDGDNDGSVVGQYGIITLDQAGIEVSDKIYYEGYYAGSDVCKAGPQFDVTAGGTQTFAYVDGFHYMNFCTWGLAVNDKCADTSPASGDCGATLNCQPF